MPSTVLEGNEHSGDLFPFQWLLGMKMHPSYRKSKFVNLNLCTSVASTAFLLAMLMSKDQGQDPCIPTQFVALAKELA